jgi:hypothetical protein
MRIHLGHNVLCLMVSKCANPSCSAAFRRMGEGRLFRIEFQASLPENARFDPARQTGRRTEYFWLCAQCAASMTIKVERGEVVVSKLPGNSATHVA